MKTISVCCGTGCSANGSLLLAEEFRKKLTETGAPAQESAKTGVTDSPVEDDKPKVPVIGMDGKTEDGSVPYEILKDRLEWMK